MSKLKALHFAKFSANVFRYVDVKLPKPKGNSKQASWVVDRNQSVKLRATACYEHERRMTDTNQNRLMTEPNMPKFQCKKLERKLKILCDLPTHGDGEKQFLEIVIYKLEKEARTTLNSIASIFPKVIQKILLNLPPATHKSLRLTNKSLKHAVDEYVGVNVILSENHTDLDFSAKVQIITKDLQHSLRNVGIRRLKGVHLIKTKFQDIITHPYLLQSINLFGQVDQHVLLGLLKECWNLRSIRLLEPNQYKVLVRGNFIDFMRSVATLVEHRKGVPLDNLKYLKIQCSTTSTMGFMLVLLSVLEVKNLETFHCCIGPVHANFYTLITGLVVKTINSGANTLKDLWLVVDSSDAYPEITAKRRFLRKLTLFNEECPGKLAKFHQTFAKMYLMEEERDDWLKSILSETGSKTINLSRIRLDIDTINDFSNYWIHFLSKQHSLSLLEVQAACHWSVIQSVVKQNARTLETLGLVVEFHSPMDLSLFLKDCSKLRRLILKNFDFDWMSREQLEMRRTGHIVNATFDELFPDLESLALSNLLVRSSDLGRVKRIPKLTDFVLSILEMDGENGDNNDPENMFGLLDTDFRDLLHRRSLNHIILSHEAIVYCGSVEEQIEAMHQQAVMVGNVGMFHETNLLGWKLLSIDDEHIAVAHGGNVTSSDWIFPLILSVIEDTLEIDAISTQSIIAEGEDDIY